MVTAKELADRHEEIAWQVGPEEAWGTARRFHVERDRLAAECLTPEERAARVHGLKRPAL